MIIKTLGAKQGWILSLVAALILGASNAAVQAEVNIATVTVGNPGNAADSTGYGAVSYSYNIGTYEVTAGQYTAFLNSVATAGDAYGLYNTNMGDISALSGPGIGRGCNIQRTGAVGNYSYSVAADWANRPVNYVSRADSLRFSNWLTNGQRVDTSTTEYGSYALNGATSNADVLAVMRNSPAQGGRYYLPTENEWYKAAYYDPAKSGGAGYWAYATRSNSAPGLDMSEVTNHGNNANYYIGDLNHLLGAPYWRTPVGEFEASLSAYGTLDQAGNVDELNEAIISGQYVGVRGGSFQYRVNTMTAGNRYPYNLPDLEDEYVGFRVSEVPEPATLSLLALGLAGLVLRRKGTTGQ